MNQGFWSIVTICLVRDSLNRIKQGGCRSLAKFRGRVLVIVVNADE